jgi:hypothetical protein
MKIYVYFLIHMAMQSVKFNGRFGGTCHVHLHVRRISRARIEQKATESSIFCCLASLISRPCRRRRRVSAKCPLTFNGLHGIIYQKKLMFSSPNYVFGCWFPYAWNMSCKSDSSWLGHYWNKTFVIHYRLQVRAVDMQFSLCLALSVE